MLSNKAYDILKFIAQIVRNTRNSLLRPCDDLGLSVW